MRKSFNTDGGEWAKWDQNSFDYSFVVISSKAYKDLIFKV